MQIISSYGVELRKQNISIRQTLEIYRSAVSYLIGIYVQVWEELAEIPDAKRRFNARRTSGTYYEEKPCLF
ncbi:hypothetical protein M5E86_20765 [Blautia wexlerae]|nr:hypothetical protein M5E86_20765 [Blautia wexlerae]